MNELLIPSKIVHSKRKSIALIVDREGQLVVRAPLHCKDEDITDFILKKSNWIITKRSEYLNSAFKVLTFNNGETVQILGKPYRISLYNGYKVYLKDDCICIPTVKPSVRLKQYLRNLTKTIINEKVTFYCQNYNLTHKQITITGAKTRWGSCGYKNSLNFTYKLAMCPEDVIDYVVVHELCHTIEKNHSRKFWARVADILPNYKQQEKWLKDNKRIIDVI